MRSPAGMEVGLVGVDGAGKTSIAGALAVLDPRVVVVYMGYKQFRTLPMRLYEQGRLVWPLGRFTSHYEWCWRRIHGQRMARRGSIVIYDRHPAEHCLPHARRLGDRIGNLLNRAYDCDLDLSFLLSGDPEAIFARKGEYSPEKLREMDRTLRLVLARKRIVFEEINVTSRRLPSVTAAVVAGINRKCVELGIPKLGGASLPALHELEPSESEADVSPSTASADAPIASQRPAPAIPSDCAVQSDEQIRTGSVEATGIPNEIPTVPPSARPESGSSLQPPAAA